jgi:Flp pilus assembly protein TadG
MAGCDNMDEIVSGPAQLRERRRAGSSLVEGAFVLVVLLGFIFFILDLSWCMFAKLTLQQAVRAGVRYAVTSQTMVVNGNALGQTASIQDYVQNHAMGLISDPTTVSVTFYAPGSSTALTGAGANSGGNLVVVTMNAFQLQPLIPFLHSSAAIPITVSSGDLIEISGSGATPPPL